MRKTQLIALSLTTFGCFTANAQYLSVPTGTSGISTSTTLEIGIKTNNPQQNLHIFQDGIPLPSNPTDEQSSSGIRLDYRYLDNFQTKYSTWDIRARSGALEIMDMVSSEKILTIRDDGKVGISTTAPRQKLEVDGNILLGNYNTTSYNLLFAGNTPTSTGWGHWGIEYSHTPEPGMQSGLNFWKPSGSSNFGNYFLFLADQGNVGIGTANPQYALHVEGNFHASEGIVAPYAEITQINSDIDFGASTSFEGRALFRDITEFNEKVSIGIDINNLPGDYMLYVKDGILAESVKVAVSTTADWADYVFAEDYNLMPLNEVEEFINEHKHLPSVPSSEEMVNSGLDLGKMDAKLLEKIEELTLYVIDLKKESDELRKENEEMKMQMAELMEAQD